MGYSVVVLIAGRACEVRVSGRRVFAFATSYLLAPLLGLTLATNAPAAHFADAFMGLWNAPRAQASTFANKADVEWSFKAPSHDDLAMIRELEEAEDEQEQRPYVAFALTPAAAPSDSPEEQELVIEESDDPVHDGEFDFTWDKEIRLARVYTGERLRFTPMSRNRDIHPDAAHAIRRLLRARRGGLEHPIHPRVVRLLVLLTQKLDAKEIHIISGYRKPGTKVTRESSYHASGMAVDVRVPGRSLQSIYDAASELGTPGIGMYPANNFAHLDVRPIPYRWQQNGEGANERIQIPWSTFIKARSCRRSTIGCVDLPSWPPRASSTAEEATDAASTAAAGAPELADPDAPGAKEGDNHAKPGPLAETRHSIESVVAGQ